MGLQPKITNILAFRDKKCLKCGDPKDSSHYPHSKSIAAVDGFSEICAECIEDSIEKSNYDWSVVDQWCQYLNIPFIPNEFEEIRKCDIFNGFQKYSEIFFSQEYEKLNWKQYYDAFKELEEANLITRELPHLKEDRLMKLRDKWGANYSEEQLTYLENLYESIFLSQTVNGGLQEDQAKKLCKTSLEIDERIRAGQDYDKILSSYEKLVKIAEFTPKNAKNASDFDSVGELFHWLEKRGWKNDFYDNVTRDVVDETMKNIQNYNQKLYVNETGIGEEISRRLEALKSSNEQENYYDSQQDYDLDNFDNEGYEELFDEEFKEEI